MRIISVLFLALTFSLAGCLKSNDGCAYKDNNITAPASEVAALENYLFSNGITTATKDPSGFYYQIITPGTGTTVPGLCNVVGVAYVGKLTNGNTFDQSTGVSFQLGALIEGWKKGIPLIKEAGKIKLYLPPSLGYGAADIKDQTGAVKIPANSILIFDIDLIEVQ